MTSPDTTAPDLAVAIRTLAFAGYALERVDRKPGYAIVLVHRLDEFGAMHRNCFAISEAGQFGQGEVDAIRGFSEHVGAPSTLVGETSAAGEPCVTWNRFVGLLGGPVLGTQPVDPEFSNQIMELAFNRLPAGLSGTADDLFEGYVRSAFQFILGVRVIRYGQDRRFEARPDGIVLPQLLAALYDAKAYAEGYEVSLDTIRQFTTYVEEFHQRYRPFIAQLDTFVVVSGRFPHREDTLQSRSRDLQAACGVPLSFLTAEALCGIVDLIRTQPRVRRAIRWKRVFLDPIVSLQRVRDEIDAVNRHGVIR